MRYDLVIVAVLGLAQCSGANDAFTIKPQYQDIKVLDGDTVVFEEKLVKIRGIDAPELGPWAKCWAEAALAGHSRSRLEEMLFNETEAGPWKLTAVSEDRARNLIIAKLVRESGDDIADSMIVYGSAAKTTGKWNWCGANANLRNVDEGEPEPHGPNLWWPTGKMYDKRAAD